MSNIKFQQRHETEMTINWFEKSYKMGSYEFFNEVKRLRDMNQYGWKLNFQVPRIISTKVVWENDILTMWVIKASNITANQSEQLVKVIAALHDFKNYTVALQRDWDKSLKFICKKDYPRTLSQILQYKYSQISLEKNINIKYSVKNRIFNVLCWHSMPGNFVICHKDARIRHLLYDENLGEKPYLIDREFANISDGAQDLAKIIYDLHINHNIDLVRAYHDVISQYEVHISNKALLYNLKNRILSFLYIIPFERLGGLISQKKEWYMEEADKDINFIYKIFEWKYIW